MNHDGINCIYMTIVFFLKACNHDGINCIYITCTRRSDGIRLNNFTSRKGGIDKFIALHWESAKIELWPRGIAITQVGLGRPRATAYTGLSTRISPARRRRSGVPHQLLRRSKAPGWRGAESQCRQTTAVYVNLQRETRRRVTCAL